MSDNNSICAALNVLSSFNFVSSIKLNLNKTQAIYMGGGGGGVANGNNIGNDELFFLSD